MDVEIVRSYVAFYVVFLGLPTLLFLLGAWLVIAKRLGWKILGAVCLVASAAIFYIMMPFVLTILSGERFN